MKDIKQYQIESFKMKEIIIKLIIIIIIFKASMNGTNRKCEGTEKGIGEWENRTE